MTAFSRWPSRISTGFQLKVHVVAKEGVNELVRCKHHHDGTASFSMMLLFQIVNKQTTCSAVLTQVFCKAILQLFSGLADCCVSFSSWFV